MHADTATVWRVGQSVEAQLHLRPTLVSSAFISYHPALLNQYFPNPHPSQLIILQGLFPARRLTLPATELARVW